MFYLAFSDYLMIVWRAVVHPHFWVMSIWGKWLKSTCRHLMERLEWKISAQPSFVNVSPKIQPFALARCGSSKTFQSHLSTMLPPRHLVFGLPIQLSVQCITPRRYLQIP